MKLAYLAGPIDQAGNREELWTDRQRARLLLREAGFVVYDPSQAFTGSIESLREADDPRIGQMNWKALFAADAVMAMLPRGVPTIGTPMEMMAAVQNGTPVAVIGAQGSWQVAEMVGPQVWQFDEDELAQAVKWLREQAAFGLRRVTDAKPLKLTLEGADSTMPVRHHEGDAGFDLFVLEQTLIAPGQFVDVKSGVRVELPAGIWGMIVGRSSTLRKRNLLVNTGIIDNGYRGELFSGVKNLGGSDVLLKPGERIAQFIPLPLTASWLAPVKVEELMESDRGEAGFGSTGW